MLATVAAEIAEEFTHWAHSFRFRTEMLMISTGMYVRRRTARSEAAKSGVIISDWRSPIR